MTKIKTDDLYLKIIFTVIAVSLVALVILIAKQKIFIGSNHNQKSSEASNSALISPIPTTALLPISVPVITSAPVDPHAGMKEVKTMNCQPEGTNGATNCTEYDYWYNPNQPSRTETLAPNMLQGAH
ncbi:MAG: hypothetical protein NT149_02455 [Candidatus Gottesmanbacteria bacterium]|nr:hypothetical protein [Candidatus Gottesmanbacteria bacterium]